MVLRNTRAVSRKLNFLLYVVPLGLVVVNLDVEKANSHLCSDSRIQVYPACQVLATNTDDITRHHPITFALIAKWKTGLNEDLQQILAFVT